MNLNNLTTEEAKNLLIVVQDKHRKASIKCTGANNKAVALEIAGDEGSQDLGSFRKERKMYRLERDDCSEKIQAIMEFIGPGINE